MQRRSLGQQGLVTSAIGLGTMGMTTAYGAGAVATIRRAHELGLTLIDTAELYGGGSGSSERLIGRAIRGFRDEMVVATKFGFGEKMTRRLDSRPEHIREVTENSLRHLETDHLDVLYQHRVDPEVPIEEVAGAVGELIEEGKVRFFGLSEAGPGIMRRAHAVQPVSVLQSEYSLFERGVEADVLPVVRELGIGFVAYAPLGRGFLTGAVRPAAEYPAHDMRSWDERWQPGNYETNVVAIQALRRLAEQKGITVAQLALAWLLAQGEDIVAIPGMRRPVRAAENAAAAEVELARDELEEINAIIPHGAYGSRYPAAMMPHW